MMAKDNPVPASKIVSAVGASSRVFGVGGKSLSKQIEAAMSQAVLDCNKEGISDPKKIKERMMMARQEVRDSLVPKPSVS